MHILFICTSALTRVDCGPRALICGVLGYHTDMPRQFLPVCV